MKKTLLYVEDDQWRYANVVRILKTQFDVITARDADQALSIIETQIEEHGKPTVDLILLDIAMPVSKRVGDANRGHTSGVNLARLLIHQHKLDVPIVCYTVQNNTRIFEELLDEIGVKEIVSKSKSPMELITILKKYLD